MNNYNILPLKTMKVSSLNSLRLSNNRYSSKTAKYLRNVMKLRLNRTNQREISKNDT